MELATIDDLASSLLQPSALKAHHDFIVFRRTPFLKVSEDNAIPIHLGFVQEKLESGLFWTIFNSLSSRQERARLFTDWGHLYERYVSLVISECLEKSGETYSPFPKFADSNEEAFDGIVSSGKYWVVMEYKGGFLSARAKYSEDEGEFLRELGIKFGEGKGAGIEQLVRKIAAVFALRPNKRRYIKDMDSSSVGVVISRSHRSRTLRELRNDST